MVGSYMSMAFDDLGQNPNNIILYLHINI